MSKKGLKSEQCVTADRAALYLDELAKGLRRGRLEIYAGQRAVCLNPPSIVEMELEASGSEDRQQLSLAIRWRVSHSDAVTAQAIEPEGVGTVEVEPASEDPQMRGPCELPDPPMPGAGTNDGEGYCVKCRARREIAGATSLTLSNGRSAIQGTCPVCGTRMTRMVKGHNA